MSRPGIPPVLGVWATRGFPVPAKMLDLRALVVLPGIPFLKKLLLWPIAPLGEVVDRSELVGEGAIALL